MPEYEILRVEIEELLALKLEILEASLVTHDKTCQICIDAFSDTWRCNDGKNKLNETTAVYNKLAGV